ncbi:MAG: hypothetical protein GXY44_11785 [Phycisphaerales bacterium]|nr:hypothetical protein [Phycisphaerales bacterium]
MSVKPWEFYGERRTIDAARGNVVQFLKDTEALHCIASLTRKVAVLDHSFSLVLGI